MHLIYNGIWEEKKDALVWVYHPYGADGSSEKTDFILEGGVC